MHIDNDNMYICLD